MTLRARLIAYLQEQRAGAARRVIDGRRTRRRSPADANDPSARFLLKSSALFSKMAMRLVSRSTHLLAAAELHGVVEVRHVGQLVGVRQWGDDFLVDLVADVALA